MGARCPQGFQYNPLNPYSCVKECPSQNGFVISTRNNMPVCEYSARNTVFFRLLPSQAMRLDDNVATPPMTQIRTSYPSLYTQYMAAETDYESKKAIAMTSISRDIQLADAFQALQTAEGVRDTAPQAYQDARTRYYTLLNGETWVQQERDRIARAEADPIVARYRSAIQNSDAQRSSQQQTMEVMRNVKDKVLSMKDDFQYSVQTFDKQINALKNEINIESKQRKATEHAAKSWMESIVNYILIALLVVLVGVLALKVYRKKSVPTTSQPVSNWRLLPV